MTLLSEIREHFAAEKRGIRVIESLPENYSANTLRLIDGYGVAIEYNRADVISEKFASCRLFVKEFVVNSDEVKKYLVLLCSNDSLRYEFATLCAQFVAPGVGGEDRKLLLDNPFGWWEKWRELLGNIISIKDPYSVIAEMMALEKAYKKDNTAKWTAIESGSHDIECLNEDIEVKSSLKKYEATITITGQHQLKKGQKRLLLYFCKFEKSRDGVSINDMVDKLVQGGYDKELIETQLEKIGYELGSSSRDAKYKILEKREYEVDEHFPSITDESFKENHLPNAVIRVSYTVDLDGIEYNLW